MHLLLCLVTSFLITGSYATAKVEGNCLSEWPWIQPELLSPNCILACRGTDPQQFNANRYWGTQFGRNASLVAFPATPEDVARTMGMLNSAPPQLDWSFVGGAHGMINGSSANDFVVDLSYLNKTVVLESFDIGNDTKKPVISYQGGANWKQVNEATNSSGYIAVGARDSAVGVGGFSTGGGIGFLAGAYGYATDRLVQVEVALPCGKLVNATKSNEFSDLFWALHGGNGQFGIVTTFYALAAPEPTRSQIGVYYIDDADLERARANTVTFFEHNTDPFSLMYYAIGFVPPNLATTDPSTFATRTLLVALRFANPLDPHQPDYNATFAPLFAGINTTNSIVCDVPYANATDLVDPFFPYGLRRGFYGPQVPAVTPSYLRDLSATFAAYIAALQARGEDPATAVFVLQYMFPGLNGNLPAADADTAWPHGAPGAAKGAHQTLFSPAWLRAADDALMLNATGALNALAYAQQERAGVFVADYPNYISPRGAAGITATAEEGGGRMGWNGTRLWGANVRRLEQVKQRYDPSCLIRKGAVFGSPGCKARGAQTVF